jgi:hypothetical protein
VNEEKASTSKLVEAVDERVADLHPEALTVLSGIAVDDHVTLLILHLNQNIILVLEKNQTFCPGDMVQYTSAELWVVRSNPVGI